MKKLAFLKSFKNLVILAVFFMGFLVVPFSMFVRPAKAEPVFGEYPKWTLFNMGSTASCALIADVRTDIPGEEVIVTGVDWVRAFRGTDGSTIWERELPEVWYWTQPQMADLNLDGILEIVVPFGDWPSGGNGLYALHGNNGSIFWESRGEIGGNSYVGSPVIGDIDGDGYPTIFTATEDVTSGLQGTGRLTSLDHLGNVLHQTFIWRPCAGGLSLADGDHDGVYELYMGDRDMYNGDGSGRGVRSWWAENLSVRWNHADVLCSSQAPPLADVNGDGILDVIVSNQRGGVVVLDSRTGSALRKDVRRRDLPTHYQGSVYDIDEDGNLEILFADGDHSSTPNDCAVFDLVNWEVDGRFDIGLCHYGPTVANVYGDDSLEIIATSNDGIHIIDPETYTVIDEVTGLDGTKLHNAVVQDIDDDGLVEIVVTSEAGTVWAYNTPAAAPAQRARSEVQFYNERRTNAAVYIPSPGEEPEPIISGVNPSDKKENTPLSLSELRFTLTDNQDDQMSYTVTTSPDIGSDSGTNVDSGTEIVVSVTGSLDYYTSYMWEVKVTDGTSWTNKTYKFRTEFEPVSNNVPTHDDPFLDDGDGTSLDQLTCFNQSTVDSDGDPVTNVYNWYLDDVSLTRLLLPFDARNATTAKDYSGYGNTASVYGVTWTTDGIVGGCYEFEGDDYIKIPHSSTLGGDGTWSEITIEHWIYFSENQDGSRTILKTRSYEIGFQSGRNNRIYAGVWTEEDNDRQTSTYTLSRNTWYHIAMTYKDGEGITLYVNGIARRSNTRPSGNITASAGTRPETHEPLYIGWFDFFTGKIDEVRIYPRALSTEQLYQRYLETKDGISDNASIVWQETLRGESWKCQITPNDMYSDGLPKFSNTTDPLLNAPPSASNLRFPKRSRSEFALSSEDLEGAYDYFDVDGDPDTGSKIRWYKDSVLQPVYNDLLTVPSSATTVGESWNFTVEPSDGDLFGSLETSPQVTVIQNDPPTHSNPLLESSAGTDRDDEEITCYNQSTSDTEPVTNIYNWYVDDVSYTNLLLPFDTDAATIVKDYSGYGNNGIISGATWTSNGVSGGAYTFDGDDVITVEDDETLGGNNTWSAISLEFWVKTASPHHGTRIVARKPADASTGSFMVGFQTSSWDPDNTLFWGITVDGDWTDNSEVENWTDVRDRLTLETGKWYHVFCTYESGPGLTIYVNGIRKHNMPLTGNIDYDPDEMLFIGSSGEVGDSRRWLNGSLDEIRLYRRSLTAAQVFQRYLDTKDGLSNSSTIVPQETVQDEDWKCKVTPNDSWQDGTERTSNTLTILSAGGNSRPRIDVFTPTETTLEINEGESLNFTHFSSDPDGDTLTHSWFLDDVEQMDSQNWTYSTSVGDAGTHNVTLVVSDGEENDSQQWNIAVISVSEEDYYLVVRGLNNRIYYRTNNASSGNWENWNVVPTGVTCDSPAAIMHSGRLYIVVRGMDGRSLWFGWVNLTDGTFEGWTGLSGATSSPPTLAGNDSHLILLVRGLNNKIYYRYYDCASDIWEGWNVITNGVTCDRPAATVTGDTLHIVVRGFSSTSVSGNQSLWHGRLDLTNSSFSGWTRLSGATPSPPTLTASENSGEVYLTVRGSNDGIYINTWNGIAWQGWEQLAGATCDRPAATVTGDTLHIVVRGKSGTGLWHSHIDLTTSDHSGWSRLSGETSSTPTLAS